MKKEIKFLVRHLDDVKRPLNLIMPKMNGYIKTFDDNKLIYFRIDEEQLEKYKIIRTKRCWLTCCGSPL